MTDDRWQCKTTVQDSKKRLQWKMTVQDGMERLHGWKYLDDSMVGNIAESKVMGDIVGGDIAE